MADCECPATTPGLKPEVEVTIWLPMSTKGKSPVRDPSPAVP